MLSDKRVSICLFVAGHGVVIVRWRLRVCGFVALLLESVRYCGTLGVPNCLVTYFVSA